MVKVCDAVMGMGKTSAAINFINAHPEKKFIFITPYLDEAARVKAGCPDANFVEPSDKIRDFNFSKCVHASYLIEHGYNLATTHQAFKFYSKDMVSNIRHHGYTLIIDENMDVLESADFKISDLNMLMRFGLVERDGMKFMRTDMPAPGDSVFEDLLRSMESRDLMYADDSKSGDFFYWALPYSLISAFEDVYVLTYLFESQGLYNFFKIYNIDYEYISVRKDNGAFLFDEESGYVPAFIPDIFDMLEVFDNTKLNTVGKNRTSLSMSWYVKNENAVKAKNNLYNFFRNYNSGVPHDQKMWGAHKSERHKLKGKGYSKGYVNFNIKATNKYSHMTCLAYMTNVFMNVSERILYQRLGIEADEDMFALSTLIQWVWRSAIRNGEHVCLYLPSKRMRDILLDWMDKVSRGVAV